MEVSELLRLYAQGKRYFAGITLDGVSLEEVDLSGVNFMGASLQRANLLNVNLMGANLKKANLSDTFLVGANLVKANLMGADLTGALLVEANLEDADLSGADLQGASLEGARLRNSILVETNIERLALAKADVTGADLRYVKYVVPFQVPVNTDLDLNRETMPEIWSVLKTISNCVLWLGVSCGLVYILMFFIYFNQKDKLQEVTKFGNAVVEICCLGTVINCILKAKFRL